MLIDFAPGMGHAVPIGEPICRRLLRFRLWATAAATVVILAGLAAFIRFNEEVPALSTAQHIASAYARFGAISPNGGRLAYVDHRDDVLYVSELSHAADRRRISRRVVGFGVAWSSDGSRLAYVR